MGNALHRPVMAFFENEEDEDDTTDDEHENEDNGQGPSEGVEAVRGGAQKRKHEENDEEKDSEIDTLMHTPKKKRLKTTSRYVRSFDNVTQRFLTI